MRRRLLSPITLVLLATLSGCLAADPSTSPGPSAASLPGPSASSSRPSASTLPSPAATAEPAPSATFPESTQLQPDSFAQVVTDSLRVRTEPFVGDASRKLEPLLWNGASLFVIDGPVAGSGYDWYLVEVLPEVDLQIHPDPPQPGWVAAGSREGETWIAPQAGDCFDTPLGWLQFELTARPIGLDALSCFGDRPLEFTALLSVESGGGCRDTTGPWTFEPAWLGPCPDPAYRLADADSDMSDQMNALAVTIAPSVDLRSLPTLESDEWLLVDVIGQYAHPDAASCRATPTGGDGEGPPRPEVVVLHCRDQFVVTSMKAHADI